MKQYRTLKAALIWLVLLVAAGQKHGGVDAEEE